MLHKQHQKSLAFTVKKMIDMINYLDNEVSVSFWVKQSLEHLVKIYTMLENVDLNALLQDNDGEYIYKEYSSFLNEINSLLLEFSEEFTKNYFSHFYEY